MRLPICLALGCLVLGPVRGDEVASDAPVPLQFTAPLTSAPIVIDGYLTEPAWQQAPAVPVHFVDKPAGEPKPEAGTTMKVIWDGQYLYLGYTVLDADLQAKGTGELQGPKTNQREGVDAVPTARQDFVEFFISFNDPNFVWEVHHDPANHFSDIWCVMPEKDWPMYKSSMHYYGVRFNHREIIEDQGPYTVRFAVGLRLGETYRNTVNDSSDTDYGWSGEIRLPWGGIGAPEKARSTVKPLADDPRFTLPGPWKMAGQTINLLGVVHRGDLAERYYHSSPTRKGDWFHKSYAHWPVFELVAGSDN